MPDNSTKKEQENVEWQSSTFDGTVVFFFRKKLTVCAKCVSLYRSLAQSTDELVPRFDRTFYSLVYHAVSHD